MTCDSHFLKSVPLLLPLVEHFQPVHDQVHVSVIVVSCQVVNSAAQHLTGLIIVIVIVIVVVVVVVVTAVDKVDMEGNLILESSHLLLLLCKTS